MDLEKHWRLTLFSLFRFYYIFDLFLVMVTKRSTVERRGEVDLAEPENVESANGERNCHQNIDIKMIKNYLLCFSIVICWIIIIFYTGSKVFTSQPNNNGNSTQYLLNITNHLMSLLNQLSNWYLIFFIF